MEHPNQDIRNQIEEAKYQLRVEIAEKCLAENAPVSFIMRICSFTKKEITSITRSIKRREELVSKRTKNQQKKELELKIQEQKLKEKNDLTNELKRIENEKITSYKQERQREADLQREIAAENTRLLLLRIKNEKTNQIRQNLNPNEEEREKEILRKRKLERKPKNTKQKEKKEKKQSLEDDNSSLTEEQKMIASVGNCYLRGLNVKQAILFSKASKEDVERIYNSFKNK